tara:strand:- start:2567 stop:3553 length:987 start_codon:yes stop_codon:yes gene_type:complete
MAFESVSLQIYIYSGTSGSYTDTDLKYTLSKSLIGTDTNIMFEIGELVRDYITVSFNNDYLSNAIWVSTVGTIVTDLGSPFDYGSPVINHYLAFDGYGYFEDEINPQLSTDALISANTIYLPEGTAGKLPLFAEGVGKVIIDTTTTEVTDNGNSNQKVQYLTIPANSSIIKLYATDDATLLKTINVNNVCEPKFTPYKVTFLNRMGSYQDVYFFKKSVETFNVTDETYKRNTVSTSSVSYLTNETQQQRYNANATKSITLNTGFINEDSNQTIEELFLAENVWIRYDGKTLPLIPKSKSMTFKTSLNDKLANYTVDFEFAFNKINNVR